MGSNSSSTSTLVADRHDIPSWVPIALAVVIGCGGEATNSTSISCSDDEACGAEVDAGAPLPGLTELWAVRDPEVQGTEIAVASDGSVWIAGGSDRTYFDLTFTYPSYFLARYDGASGTLLWETRTADYAAAVGLALSMDAHVATVSTNYVDGNRTTLLVHDARSGALSANREILEEAGAAIFDTDDVLVLGGSHLLEYVGGRPTSALWLSGVDRAGEPLWTLMPSSPQLGWTGVTSFARATDGTLVVGAFQGVTTLSNASVPWALGVRDGAVAWEHVHGNGTETTGRVESVAARSEGGVLLRGTDANGTWVRGLSNAGETEWTEPFDFVYGRGAIASLPSGGFALTQAKALCLDCNGPLATGAVVTGYDAARLPSWEIEVPDCESAVASAALPDGTFVVLAICDWGLGLFGYQLPED